VGWLFGTSAAGVASVGGAVCPPPGWGDTAASDLDGDDSGECETWITAAAVAATMPPTAVMTAAETVAAAIRFFFLAGAGS
jgi:hypothetical protein